MASSNIVRMGILGGGFGGAFQWHLHPNCKVEAVCDLSEERRKRAAEIYKCSKTYCTLDEMLKDRDVDAVAVFSGAPDHVKHAAACMEAGKHVISAVPACVSLEQAVVLLECQKRTGMTYMMAETSYYHPLAISARKFFAEGAFGDLFYTEAEYHHSGMEYSLWRDKDGRPTWRHGLPPMLYPTHCTAFLVGVTGERLTEVTCVGWGDGDPIMDGNPYNNKFWSETALFKTDRGHAFRAAIYWRGAFGGCERAQWYGSKMSLFEPHPNGVGPVIRRSIHEGGTERREFEPYQVPDWKAEMLPEPLRLNVGHEGAEPFLTHEFVDAILHDRKPAIDIHEALAYTIPGIIAHMSAERGGVQMAIPDFR